MKLFQIIISVIDFLDILIFLKTKYYNKYINTKLQKRLEKMKSNEPNKPQ